MGFWSKKRETVPPEQRVEQALAEAAGLAGEKPKAALKVLDRLKGDAYPLVSFGGAYHEQFARIVGQALEMNGPFPGVSAVPWSRWTGVLTVADVLALAGEGSQPVLYLFEPPGRLSRGPATDLGGLKVLAEDDRLAMVVVGEMNTYLRREPLLSLTGRVDASTEEILEELKGAFHAAGYGSTFLVG